VLLIQLFPIYRSKKHMALLAIKLLWSTCKQRNNNNNKSKQIFWWEDCMSVCVSKVIERSTYLLKLHFSSIMIIIIFSFQAFPKCLTWGSFSNLSICFRSNEEIRKTEFWRFSSSGYYSFFSSMFRSILRAAKQKQFFDQKIYWLTPRI
jgi:hypothetical protein